MSSYQANIRCVILRDQYKARSAYESGYYKTSSSECKIQLYTGEIFGLPQRNRSFSELRRSWLDHHSIGKLALCHIHTLRWFIRPYTVVYALYTPKYMKWPEWNFLKYPLSYMTSQTPTFSKNTKLYIIMKSHISNKTTLCFKNLALRAKSIIKILPSIYNYEEPPLYDWYQQNTKIQARIQKLLWSTINR